LLHVLNHKSIFVNLNEKGFIKMVITRTSIYCGENYFHRVDKDIIYDKIPPLIGCLISDKVGKSLVSFEIFEGAIQYYVKDECLNKNTEYEHSLDVDLIPMYTSALEMLTRELNIKGVPYIEVNGSNLKLRILFCFEHFTIIMFLNPSTDFELIENEVKNYILNLFDEFQEDLNDVKKFSSKEFLKFIDQVGWRWLLELNERYLSSI
jgi:hypothetical protein